MSTAETAASKPQETAQAHAAKKPGKREQNARAIRQKILESSRQLFSEIGYQNATITKIRELADVSIATFYKYFDSKQTVLLALHEADHEHYEQMALNALAADVEDQTDYLLNVILATLDPPDSPEVKALWREILAAFISLSAESVGAETISADRDYYSGHIRQALERLIALKLLKRETPVQPLTEVLYCISSHEFQDFVCGRYESGQALQDLLRNQIAAIVEPWHAA